MDIGNYIRQNFLLIFESSEPCVLFSYGTEKPLKLHIPDLTQDYFSNYEPLNHQKIVWLEWKGTSVPFLFSENTEITQIVSFNEKEAVFHCDLIASAFYFLSGWQELTGNTKDAFGRFPYQASFQYQYHTAHLPLVCYYFDILKDTLEKVYPIRLTNKLTQKSRFVCNVSHDIDILEKSWLIESKQALLKGRFKAFIQTVFKRLQGKDYQIQFDRIRQFQQQFSFKSDFYFLPVNTGTPNVANADYAISNHKTADCMASLLQDGNSIGLHSAYGSHLSEHELKAETDLLPCSLPLLHRSHYLGFSMLATPEKLEKADFVADTTVGFAEHTGFRNATCYPFYLFNHQNKTCGAVIEFPLALMEVTIFDKRYMNLSGNRDQIKTNLNTMLDEVEKWGGILVINWHNDSFIPLKYPERMGLLQYILAEVQKRSGSFARIDEILGYLDT